MNYFKLNQFKSTTSIVVILLYRNRATICEPLSTNQISQSGLLVDRHSFFTCKNDQPRVVIVSAYTQRMCAAQSIDE